jgi:hypothetical protein
MADPRCHENPFLGNVRRKGTEMDVTRREELIDRITQLNSEVPREFLQGFDTDELLCYFRYLTNQDLELIEICG